MYVINSRIMLGWCAVILVSVATIECQSSEEPQEVLQRLRRSTQRDPYIFNLFEVILSTLDSKFRKIENIDQTVNQLSRRMERMEQQITLSLNHTSRVAHLLEVRFDDYCNKAKGKPSSSTFNHVTRVVRHRPHNSYFETPLPENKRSSSVNTVIRSLRSGDGGPKQPAGRRVSKNLLTPTVPTPTLVRTNYGKSANRGTGDSFWREILGSVPSGAKMEAQLDTVVRRVQDIDNKLSSLQHQIDTNIIVKHPEELLASASENYRVGFGVGESSRLQGLQKYQDLGVLQESVEDVRNSIESVDRRLQVHANSIGQSFSEMAQEVSSLKATLDDFEKQKKACQSQQGKNSTECVSPFEQLRAETQKILSSVVSSRREESLSKSSLKAEQEKQARILSSLREDLAQQAKRIIQDLDQVKKDLRKAKIEGGHEKVNPVELLQKATEMQQHKEDAQPPSDILDQRILEERSSTNSTSAGRAKSIGVVFPPRPKNELLTFRKEAEVASAPKIEGYSCAELYKKGQREDGIYNLQIKGTTYWFLQVYCDMTNAGGGWTVIQRRDDFGPTRESFSRSWSDYKHGFGDQEKEFWLGNENIYMLTNLDEYVLRVELEDFHGTKKYAEYSTFKLHNESQFYKLEIRGYNGTAGDSLNDPWYGSNLSPFSTFDKDNDRSSLNCASMLKGGWWWRSCGRGLNGLYFTNPNDFTARQGIVWFRWKGWDYTLKRTSMMIKPKKSIQRTTT